MTDKCGHEDTTTGHPCQRDATYPDGSCYQHTDAADVDAGGRPTKATDGLVSNIAEMIEQGYPLETAARKNDTHPSTVRRWMTEGVADPDGKYGQFSKRLARAKATRHMGYLDLLRDIAEQTNDAATVMTILKTLQSDVWGEAARGEQAGPTIEIYAEAEDRPEQRERTR